MGFRCELCDEWLNMLQFSHLCNDCYKIRTILKCYNKFDILSSLQNNFLVSIDREKDVKNEDVKFQQEEEKRLEKEFNEMIKSKEMKTIKEEEETIKEEEEDVKDLKELKKNKSESDITDDERNELIARDLMSQLMKIPPNEVKLSSKKVVNEDNTYLTRNNKKKSKNI